MYLNIVKGIAIILMIWGHCIQYCAKEAFDCFESEVFQFIYSFHMPLFMLISGYLFFFSFQKRDLKTLLIHRTQGMLQPIVFASILNTMLIRLPTFFLYGTVRITNGELLQGIYTLWFLWCVLSASTAVAVVCKTLHNGWLQMFGILLGILFVSLFPENHLHMYMYPYFVAGFYYGMYRERIPSWIKKCACLSAVGFPLMLCFYEKKHFIYITPVFVPDMELFEMLRLNGYRWTIGFFGSLFVLTIVWLFFKRSADREQTPLVWKMLGKLGENSLAIYCISVSLLSYYLPKIFDRFLLAAGGNVFAENMLVFNFVITPVLTVLFGFGLYAVVQLMKKVKIHRLIFGR